MHDADHLSSHNLYFSNSSICPHLDLPSIHTLTNNMAQPETQQCEPSLLGLPSELRMKIFEQLFVDETIVMRWDQNRPFDPFPLAPLRTCQLIYHEAKQALRQRLSECELDYRLDPSSFEDTFMQQDCERKRHQSIVNFLQQYGELLSRLRVRDDYYDETIHRWMPNLKHLVVEDIVLDAFDGIDIDIDTTGQLSMLSMEDLAGFLGSYNVGLPTTDVYSDCWKYLLPERNEPENTFDLKLEVVVTNEGNNGTVSLHLLSTLYFLIVGRNLTSTITETSSISKIPTSGTKKVGSTSM